MLEGGSSLVALDLISAVGNSPPLSADGLSLPADGFGYLKQGLNAASLKWRSRKICPRAAWSWRLLNGNDSSLFPYVEVSYLLGISLGQRCWCLSSVWLGSRVGTVLGVGGMWETCRERRVWTTAAGSSEGIHSRMEEYINLEQFSRK